MIYQTIHKVRSLSYWSIWTISMIHRIIYGLITFLCRLPKIWSLCLRIITLIIKCWVCNLVYGLALPLIESNYTYLIFRSRFCLSYLTIIPPIKLRLKTIKILESGHPLALAKSSKISGSQESFLHFRNEEQNQLISANFYDSSEARYDPF